MDKLKTHVKVSKNGIEDMLPITTWNAIGGVDNKDGWSLIPTTPPEVIAIKQKIQQPEIAEEEIAIEPEISEAKKTKKTVKA